MLPETSSTTTVRLADLRRLRQVRQQRFVKLALEFRRRLGGCDEAERQHPLGAAAAGQDGVAHESAVDLSLRHVAQVTQQGEIAELAFA